MTEENDNLLNFERDEEGRIRWSERTNSPMLKARYYNFDSAEGIEYFVDVTKSPGSRVIITSFSNGTPFELDKTYTVAINSYRGTGGGGHLTLGSKIPLNNLPNRVLTSTEKDLRFFLMKWIEKKGIITINKTPNWKVIPEKWWMRGREKDYKLLYKTSE
jgi:2',3'-cyclic-nucleotide 2'-phosphodiesterase/3'-nucleotidase